ncbi:MAG: penicillin-insensitive murein endopeptidase [Methylovirgula sp.]
MRKSLILPVGFFFLLAIFSVAGRAQQMGTTAPKALPPIAHPGPSTPAKQLFGRVLTPSEAATRSIGFYSRGCLAGGIALPVNGPDWQVMRLSRNRNWGTPQLISFLERFSHEVPRVSHWPGILVGDMSQPRGGPMLTGHASHQIGLDVDIWLKPMPPYTLSREQREEMMSTNVVRSDRRDVDPRYWTPDHLAVIRAAAEDPEVQRIFANAAIKKALCREAGPDRAWLHKVRPFFGHDYHFHVRLVCPPGESSCEAQDSVPPGDGCDKASLAYWFSDAILHPRPQLGPVRPRPALRLADLPAACRTVLTQR